MCEATLCFEWICYFELISVQIKYQAVLIIWIFYDKWNRHNGDATSYPSHHHITWGKNFIMFSILHGTCTVIQAYSFVTFLGIDYDKKWASQISDDRIIIIKFMTKKCSRRRRPFITWYRWWSDFRHASVTDYEI